MSLISGSLNLEPSGPHVASYGTPLPIYTVYSYLYIDIYSECVCLFASVFVVFSGDVISVSSTRCPGSAFSQFMAILM